MKDIADSVLVRFHPFARGEMAMSHLPVGVAELLFHRLACSFVGVFVRYQKDSAAQIQLIQCARNLSQRSRAGDDLADGQRVMLPANAVERLKLKLSINKFDVRHVISFR